MSASCSRCQDQLPLYVAGSLSEEDRDWIEGHLRGCGECRATGDEWLLLRRASRLEAEDVSREPPSIASVIDAIRAGDIAPASRRDGTRAGLRRRPAAAAAAVGALALVTVVALAAPTLRARLSGVKEAASDETPTALTVGASGSRPERLAREPEAGNTGAQEGPGRHPASTLVSRRVMPTIVFPTNVARVEEPATAAPRNPQPSAAPPTVKPTDPPLTTGPTKEPATAAPTLAPITPAPEPSTATLVPSTATPAPPAGSGVITGRVLGSDSTGRAEISVRAYDLDLPSNDPVSALSSASGSYTLTLRAGRWVLAAAGVGFQRSWHGNRPIPSTADPIALGAGGVVSGVDFKLIPYPAGRVSGQVRLASGEPVSGAMIVALELADPTDPALPGSPAASTLTAADGTYDLRVPPGIYAVVAHRSWWTEPAIWWDARESPQECDLIAADAGYRTENVDFTLPVR